MNRFNYHAVSRLTTLFVLVTVTALAPAFAQSLNIAQTELRLEPVPLQPPFHVLLDTRDHRARRARETRWHSDKYAIAAFPRPREQELWRRKAPPCTAHCELIAGRRRFRQPY